MTKQELSLEVERLRLRLEEAEDTLRAIRGGEVDAVVMSGPKEAQVLALKDAEQSYRIFVETMREGAVTLMADGAIAHGNQRFAEMLQMPLEQVMGASLEELVAPDHRHRLRPLLVQGLAGNAKEEIPFRSHDGTDVWAEVSLCPVKLDEATGICLVATDITERKKAEQRLRESEEEYRMLFDSIDEGFCTIEVLFDENNQPVDYRFLEVNPSFEKQTGIENARGRTMREIAPLHEEHWFEIYGRIALTGEPARFENSAAELHRWYDVYAFRIGEPRQRRVAILFNDITGRKESEEALRQTARELKEAQRVARLGNWSMDLKTRQIVWSEEIYRMLGYDPSRPAVPYSEHGRIFTAESWARLAAELDKTVHTGESYELELETVRAGGSTGWMLARGEPLRDAHGAIVGLRGIAQDITGRKQAEAARQESETAFRTLADAMPQMVWMCTPDGLNVYFNQRWVDYTGLSLAESYGRGWSTPFHPDDQPAAWDAWNHATATGETYRVESRLRAADGSYRWFLMRGVPQRDAAGRIVKWFGTCTDIEDLKRAEEALRSLNEELEERVRERTAQLRDSEERLTLAFRASQEGVWEKNLETGAAWYSSRWTEMLGYAESEIEPQVSSWESLLHPDDRSRVRAALEGVRRGEREYKVEYRMRHKDGHYVDILSRGLPVRHEAGCPAVRIVGTHTDLTERKAAEKALRVSEEQFRTLADSVPNLSWMANPDGWIFWYNRRWYEYTGTSPQDMEGWGWQSVHDPKVLPKVLKRWKASIASGKPFEMVFPLRDAAGLFRLFLTRVIPVNNPDGTVARWLGTSTDITEQKQAEEALRQREEWLRMAHEAAHSGAWEWDLRSNLHKWSKELWKLYGLEPQTREPSYAAWLEAVHPDDRAAAERTVQKAASQRTGLYVEHRVIDQAGAERWLLTQGRPIRDRNGQVARFIGITLDITERKRAEEGLRRSERLYRAIGESINYGIWVCTPDGRNLYASESFLNLVGLTQGECAELGWAGVLHPDDAEQSIAAWKESVRWGAMWDIEHRVRGLDGQWHAILARGVPVRDEQGEISCWAGINLDISALKRAEEELRRSHDELERRVQERTSELAAINRELSAQIEVRQRGEEALARQAAELKRSNAELQQFAYVASHDLQEPLRAVSSFTKLLGERYRGKLDADADDFIGFIVDGSKRMQAMINGLLAYSRVESHAGKPRLTNCETVLENTLMDLTAALEETGGQVTHYPLPTVLADETQMRHVFQNLIGNALKFHGEAPPRVHVYAERLPGEWRFCVRDNGIGIDPEYADQIFAIFHRLHGTAEYPGTGIGLAVAKKILERHGGRIWVDSEAGKGAAFYFTIPIPKGGAAEGASHGR